MTLPKTCHCIVACSAHLAMPEMVDALSQAATALNYAFEALAANRCDPCLVSKVAQARGAIGVVLGKALLP